MAYPPTTYQQTFRTLSSKDTTPSSANNLLAGGTVTSGNPDTTVMTYTGSDAIGTLFNQVSEGFVGSMWIYIPSVAPYVARVTGKNNTGTNTWNLQLDRAFPNVSSAQAYWVVGTLKKYVIQNVGSGNALVAGQTFPHTAYPISSEILWNYKQNTLDVQALDGTGSNLLIQEEQ